MSSVLFSRDYTPEQFASLWSSLRSPSGAYIWLQWSRPTPLPSWDKSAFLGPLSAFLDTHQRGHQGPNPLGSSSQGRIFWLDGELRWRGLHLPESGQTYRLVYLGEDKPPLDGLEDCSTALEEISAPQTSPWIDLQGGHLFDEKPTNPHERLAIQLAQYHNAKGVVAFERFKTLAKQAA